MSKYKNIFVSKINSNCYMLLTRKKESGEFISALVDYHGNDLKDVSIECTSLSTTSSQNIIDVLSLVSKQLVKLNLDPMSFIPMTDQELWNLEKILHLNDYLYWLLKEAGDDPDKDSYTPPKFPSLKTITLGEISDYTNMAEHMTVDITDVLDEAKQASTGYKLEKLDIMELYPTTFDYVEKLSINPMFIIELTELIKQYEPDFCEVVDYENLE